MAGKEIKKIRLEDGRNAERHIADDGESRTIELYAEDPRPLKLEKRVIEKVRPVIVERTIQSIQDGHIIEEKVESTEPKVEMQLRQHIGVVEQPVLGASPYVTKRELVDSVVEAVRVATANAQAATVQPQAMAQSFLPSNLQNEIADRLNAVKSENTFSPFNIGLVVTFLAQFGFMLYLLFFNK